MSTGSWQWVEESDTPTKSGYIPISDREKEQGRIMRRWLDLTLAEREEKRQAVRVQLYQESFKL